MKRIFFQTGGADEAAAQLKEKILNSPDELTGKVVYYVSNKGDDSNPGTSPDKPIKTVKRASELPLRSGNVVLFERGSVFRVDDALYLRGGVYYGAYGSGEKPTILGSVRDYADPEIWVLSDKQNIWETELPYDEAGMMNFNNDTYIGHRRFSLEALSRNGDYYHDTENQICYLYFDKGNPGEYFDNIEIATTKELVFGQNVNHVSIENICFKYGTFGAFTFGNNKEIKIKNCVMSWHGGRVYRFKGEESIRYGNAAEFWYRAYDIEVSHCFIDQVFDAALTFQGCGDDRAEFNNIRFSDNLIEYCSMNIEFWAGQKDDPNPPVIEDICIENNIIRFGGYGWGGIQRPDKGDQALFLAWNRLYDNMENFVVRNNIFDCADCNMVFAKSPNEQKGLQFYGNSYYQKAATGQHDYIQIVRDYDWIATNQEEFEKAVRMFEPSYKLVKWIY